MHRDAANATRQQVSLGRTTTRFVGRGGTAITAASCEAAREISGVRAAGGFVQQRTKALHNGVRVQTVAATPGFMQYLLEAKRATPGRVLIGRDAANRAGVQSGAPLVLRSGRGADAPLIAERLPSSPRAEQWANTAFVPVPPTGVVQECWVEIPTSPTIVLPLVGALLDGARPLSSGPVDRDSLRPTPQEIRAGAFSAGRLGAAVGVLSVLVTVMVWWALRESWALYLAIGFDRAAVVRIAVVDWVLLALTPAVAGLLWGSLAASTSGADLGGPASSVVLAGAISALAVTWLRVFVARLGLRQSLAGI